MNKSKQSSAKKPTKSRTASRRCAESSGSAPKYVEAIGRNPGEEKQHSHLYVEINESPPAIIGLGTRRGYLPMCRKGWNRSNGEGFSIFRGHTGARGLCKVCARRAAANLPGVEAKPRSHKTKWL